MAVTARAYYWDASAVFSTLIPDVHHEQAIDFARREGTHLLSTLAFSEVLSVIARYERERLINVATGTAVRDELRSIFWVRVDESPNWIVLLELATRWPLSGPDLWHLALAKTLQRDRPEIRLVSFDRRLTEAASDEGLAPGQ